MNPLKFVGVARAMAALSKDPRTQVGAVVVDADGTILATGYNGFPRGVVDDPGRYLDRGVKLKFIAHAEANCVAQAARTGARLMGSSIVLTAMHPCADCAKLIIQAGIRAVYSPRMHAGHSEVWHEEREIAGRLFAEAGVEVVEYSEEE